MVDLPADGEGRAQVIMLPVVLGALESRTQGGLRTTRGWAYAVRGQ